MQHEAIVADHVTVIRDSVVALDNVSFSITPGKITGLIGPSGSGKTTLMRAIIGTQVITRGSLSVLGRPAGGKSLRAQIGYVTQSPAVYTDLTVNENLHYFAAIIGAPKHTIRSVLEQVDLVPQTGQVAASLSGGQLARLSLAVALLGNATLLVLDEPTVGLDPVLRRDLWALFAGLASEGRTLLISSHVMDEAEQCPELLLLREGKVLSHGSKRALLKDTNATSVETAFLQLVGEARNAR
ncbi:MAG: ABC transporter ATP-binding protein [Patescibacteria group bacterium]